MSAYQPKTGERCTCRRGQERDNCPACEGTGRRIDFRKIRDDALSEWGTDMKVTKWLKPGGRHTSGV